MPSLRLGPKPFAHMIPQTVPVPVDFGRLVDADKDEPTTIVTTPNAPDRAELTVLLGPSSCGRSFPRVTKASKSILHGPVSNACTEAKRSPRGSHRHIGNTSKIDHPPCRCLLAKHQKMWV